MKRISLVPFGKECSLNDCPPGFFLCEGNLCFKSEYATDAGSPEAFCDSGEYFWGRKATRTERNAIRVQPMRQT